MKYHSYKDDGVLTECNDCGSPCPMTVVLCAPILTVTATSKKPKGARNSGPCAF